jgi:hypothetical protein
MERGKVTVHPRRVKVHVDRPVSVEDYDDRSVTDLSQAVRNIVVSHYDPSVEDASPAREDSEGLRDDSAGRAKPIDDDHPGIAR